MSKLQQQLNEWELAENEAAIKYLLRKGLTPHEIKYLKWHWIDEPNSVITVQRVSKKGVSYRFKFSFFGSPMMPIAIRDHGKNIFVFSKTKTNPNQGFAARTAYEEFEIERMDCRRRRKSKHKRLLTIPAFLIQWRYWKHFYR